MNIKIGELIVETLSGNRIAENKLYDIYKKKIYLFIKNKYNNDDYDDDVSEILIKIFQNLKGYDESKSKFDTWVYLIAKNHMIDKSRKLKPIYISFTSNTFNFNENINNQAYTTYNGTFTNLSNQSIKIKEPISYINSPHDILEMNDSLDFILKKIGVENYTMLKMKYNDGYSYDEIAKEFKSNESKISNRVSWCRIKIKKGRE